MDVRLFQTPDGGEIKAVNGQLQLTEGLDTAAILSCFGGNSDDSGQTSDDSKQWWGNAGETDPAKKYRSQLQHLLKTLPLIPANLPRFEDAANADLAWMADSGVVDSVAARATMPGVNQVQVDVAFVINGKKTLFSIKPPGTSK